MYALSTQLPLTRGTDGLTVILQESDVEYRERERERERERTNLMFALLFSQNSSASIETTTV